MIEGDGLFHDTDQSPAPFTIGLVLAGVVADRDRRACCEAFYGFDEIAALDAGRNVMASPEAWHPKQ